MYFKNRDFSFGRLQYHLDEYTKRKAQSLNIKVDKDYEIVHERMT